jgi:acetyl-CoA carboxylase biotin carboxyl carrier protein
LPWLALLYLRSRFLRPRLAMLSNLRHCSDAGRTAPVRSSPSVSRDAAVVSTARAPLSQPVLWFDIQDPGRRLMDQQPACAVAETSGVKMAEDVRAEIVASVLEVVVNEGDQIGKGDIVVLLESMKMEIPVLAEIDGTVSKVSVVVGDVIQAGDLIAVIS